MFFFLILLILIPIFLIAVDGIRSGIRGDAKVVNNGLAAPNDRLASSAGNRTDTSLGLEGDSGDNWTAVVDDRLAIGNDGLAIKDDRLVAGIGKKNRYRLWIKHWSQ